MPHLLPFSRTNRLVCALVWVGLLALTAPAHADVVQYGCVLTGLQEVPPTGPSVAGGGSFVIDTAANTVTYRITFAGLSSPELIAHIHGYVDPGVNAGVVVNLPAGNPKVGVWNYNEANEADILAGKCYVNIHTNNFGGGEVRGQIVPLNASLDSFQEVPANASTGRGFAVFSVDPHANVLSYYIVTTGLSSAETAAHIHGFAPHGVGTGVLHNLPAGSPKVGSWNYNQADEERILSGQTYVNIHTVDNPAGEIRGQIVPVVVPMDGQQEAPANAANGSGIGLIAFDTANVSLSYDVHVLALSSPENAAHIHGFAPAGINAGVLQPLPLGAQKVGAWAYGAANEAQVFGGQSYLNVHTNNNPAGEIRGQITNLLVPVATAVEDPASHQPRAAIVLRASPNPFSGRTGISFSLPRPGSVVLDLVDARGRRVRRLVSDALPVGDHAILWDGMDDAGRSVADGVYYGKLQTELGTSTARLVRIQ